MKKRPKAEPFVIDGRGNFLFVNQKGKPKVAIDYNMLFVRMVKKYNKHHKDNPLPHITPHTLRHTFCTRLASKNMNPKDLQYIMGHSNISITMNWYAHASIDTAKSFGFMFLLASLVQNVWRSVCGVICGKGLSLWCLLYFFTIRTNKAL